MKNKLEIGHPKVLFYDIETSPMQVWTFRVGNKISIPASNIIPGTETKIICAAWKWGHDKTVFSRDWGFQEQNCEGIVAELSAAIDEADIIIGHNADSFDWRHLNTQRMLSKLPPIEWTKKSEDTLKQIRRHFYLPSYKLGYIAELLGKGSKDSMGMQDWIDISNKKNPAKLTKMVKYCKQDVLLLESVYKRVKPYMTPKVKANTMATTACTVCGSFNLAKNGTNAYNGKVYQKWFCRDHSGHAGRSIVGTKTIKITQG